MTYGLDLLVEYLTIYLFSFFKKKKKIQIAYPRTNMQMIQLCDYVDQ